ncbi:hypothetical protein FRB98_002170 [Tulasnella sp. 332]|nr:hypothetical protein FRB98_002170 [Tulasnella sp. 332]
MSQIFRPEMESQNSTTSLKRQASSEELRATSSKKAKDGAVNTPSGSTGQTGVPAKQPTNMTLPAIISFPPPTPDTIKIASWNVAGLRAAFKKINDVPIEPALDARYKHRYWNIAKQKGYAGTAVFSKHKPISVTYTLPDITTPDVVKGRLVILEFESCFIVGTYVPNAGQNLKSMNAKVEWQRAFELHMRHLDGQKPIIWAGDQNVAQTPLDLTNSKSNWNKTPGHTAIECEWFRDFLKGPEPGVEGKTAAFVDVWRRRNPKLQHFTYFSNMRGCRSKGIGWRLDMYVLSQRLYSRVKTCAIRDEIYGVSDHLPIILELEGTL